MLLSFLRISEMWATHQNPKYPPHDTISCERGLEHREAMMPRTWNQMSPLGLDLYLTQHILILLFPLQINRSGGLSTTLLVNCFVQSSLIGLNLSEAHPFCGSKIDLRANDSGCRVRQDIRDGREGFDITADSWPAFLFPHGKSDLRHIETGIFRSAILLKVKIKTSRQLWHPYLFFRLINSFSPRRPQLRRSKTRRTWKAQPPDLPNGLGDIEHRLEGTLPISWAWNLSLLDP